MAGENERGFWTGAASGAASGAAMGTVVAPGVGTAIGAGIGFVAGGVLGWSNADKERKAQKEAEEEAEQARIRAIMREMGARQQAEGMALAGLQRPQNKGTTNSNKAGAVGGADAPGGLIGSQLSSKPTTSGTF